MSLKHQQTSQEGPSPGLLLEHPKASDQISRAQRWERIPRTVSWTQTLSLWSFGKNSKFWRGTNLQAVFTRVMNLMGDEAGNNHLANDGSECPSLLPSPPSLAGFRATSVWDSP